jgi:hypothetical protein
MARRTEKKPTPAPQPLGSIDEVLAKHPGDWKACAAELKTIRESVVRRGDEILTLLRSDLDKIDAQIALLERLPAK